MTPDKSKVKEVRSSEVDSWAKDAATVIRGLEAQRNELLEACKEALETAKLALSYASGIDDEGHCLAHINKLEQAIAKAGGC